MKYVTYVMEEKMIQNIHVKYARVLASVSIMKVYHVHIVNNEFNIAKKRNTFFTHRNN